MRALTLWQPWAALVASGLKRIENRSWTPPGWLLDQRFAITAGKWDNNSAIAARCLTVEGEPSYEKKEVPNRMIIATAVLIAVARTADEAVRFCDGDESQRRWYFGPVGWVLDDIRQLETPIPCRGHQKLWTLRSPESELVRDARATTRAQRGDP